MGASYIPELNILHDHKRWKVVDLGVKTQSPVSQSPSAVNGVVLSPAISLSPALSILALLCQDWAALAKAAEAGKAMLDPGMPHNSSLQEGVEGLDWDVLNVLLQQRHHW